MQIIKIILVIITLAFQIHATFIERDAEKQVKLYQIPIIALWILCILSSF